ncbi:ferric iron reductase [Paenibacillus marchantiophytorum]|nr:ferric iron reductase [Paenibacillus marchantiophytorum]
MVDFNELEEKFFLTLHEPSNLLLSMPAIHLFQDEQAIRLIDMYSPLIKTSERAVAAAFFCSWYGSVCAAMQDMLFHDHGAILDVSLSNLTIQLHDNSPYSSFSFKINEVRLITVPDRDDQEAWYIRMLHSYYSNQVRPLIVALSRLTQTNVNRLWGQIVNAIYAHIDEELKEITEESCKTRLLHEFELLTHHVDAQAFGLLRNPFERKPKFIESLANPNQMVKVKTACCLAYLLDAGFGYCYTCPRLKESDRALLRAKARC